MMKRNLVAVLLLSVVLMAGCSGGDVDTSKKAPAAVTYESLGDSIKDIEGYKSWTLHSKDVKSRAHMNAIKDIYVNALADDALKNKKLPFAPGSIIVKENYANNDGEKGEMQALTVMVKMGEGYDKEHGDWGYYKMKPDFSVEADGKIEMCIACHVDATETDYIFIAGSEDHDEHDHGE